MYTKIVLFIAIILGFVFYNNSSESNITGKVVAITQIAPHPSLDRIRKGIEDAKSEKRKNGDGKNKAKK